MAVITVSKIQVRSGLEVDLPTLDTGEFGWCVDSQRLYIGKGTLEEGAPELGVTEILTEYSAGLITVSIDSINSNVANLTSYVANLSSITSNLYPVTTKIFNNNPTLIVNIGTVAVDSMSSQFINYNITRGASVRSGILTVANYSGTTILFEDSYTESSPTGVTLYFTGDIIPGTAVLGYTSTNTGTDGNITYSYTDLRTSV